MNDVTKCVCMLMIDVCIHFREIHTAGFLSGLLFTSVHRCISVCIVV